MVPLGQKGYVLRLIPLLISIFFLAWPALAFTQERARIEAPTLVWASSSPVRVPCPQSPEVRAYIDGREGAALLMDSTVLRRFEGEPCVREERVMLYLLQCACAPDATRLYCLSERAVDDALALTHFRRSPLRDFIAYSRLQDSRKPPDRVTLGSVYLEVRSSALDTSRLERFNILTADWTTPLAPETDIHFRDQSVFLARRRFLREP